MKKFKKSVSLFLLFVMVFNYITPFISVSASEIQTKSINNVEFTGTGDIELEVELVLPIEENVNNGIKYQIKNSKNQSAEFALDDIIGIKEEKVVTLGSQEGIKITATKRGVDGKPLIGTSDNRKIVYYSINAYGLAVGDYKVGLVGNNFVDYMVPVTLKDSSKRVSITNEKGMATIGDVNNDEKVDEKDKNLMLESLKNNSNKYDLNCDGVTNIADLNYITASINGTKKTAKVDDTNPIMDSSKVNIEVPTNTEVEGDLSSIFTDSSNVVTLSSKDNKEVSKENPINLVLDLTKGNNEPVEMSEIKVEVGKNNKPEEMSLVVEYVENGITKTKEVKPKETKEINGVHPFTDEEDDEDVIIIDLGSQIAVKKVTIKVTKVGSNKLADIAKVEFLNNVKMELSEPEGFYTPENIKVDESKSEQLTVTFDPVTNVTGYEIRINGDKMKNVIFQTTFNNFTIEDLKNYKTYKIAVQAVNGEWESGFGEEVTASPKFNGLPPSPDMVNVKSDYSALNLSWNDMNDTLSYYVYYRVKGTEKWTKTSLIEKNSYALKGLKDETEYEVYITGNNPNGEGPKSQTVNGKTLGIAPTITPKYKLLNTKDEGKTVTNHIKDVIYSMGTMVDGDKYSIVDDNFKTYYSHSDWQINAHYVNMGAPIIVLDNSYQMNEFILTVPDSYTSSLKKTDENDLMVHYWKGETSYQQATRKTVLANLSVRKDENNRTYYVIRTYEPINADAIQFGLTAPSKPIEFNEVKIYKYDSLLDDVANLFTDDLRLELQDGVNQSKIDELRKRADIKDNNEYNPYRDVILADLKYAEDILNDKKIDDVITLDPNYSNSYVNPGFAMTINDYQPLGVVAKPGEKLTIYVGSKNKNPNIQVVFSQFYAEAGTWNNAIGNLKVGQNIIDVPTIGNAEAERGGSVYIRYTSKPNDTPIKIRVSGGVKIPVLDTTYLKNETEKKEAIKTYISELDTHINSIKKTYGGNFKQTESVENSTEIVTRQGLFSVPATAVFDAINSQLTNINDKVERVYKSTEAFDEMIDMFYRHKGLDGKTSTDNAPKARINIRYMRMFYGAFMYAGGYHIGIEYGSVPGLVQATPNSLSKTGYFGWGISHEVGHQINQGTLAKAEVTNNVFALLAQTSNDKDKSRLEVSEIYPKIYEKVTSHTIGRAQNVFVQLGMYWQLHLAYDNTNTFEDTNSIFARINKEARMFDNKTKKYSSDDLLVLFASKASGYDLTKFFEIWGLRPTDAVKAEIASIKGIKEETRPIWYLNDEARRFRLNQGTKISDTTKLTASIKNTDNANKEVTLNFNVTGDKNKILGYEIIRNGVSVAFIEGSETSYVDKLGSENNRAYTYEVVAYDYLLNKTNTVKLEEIKISYDGSIASKDTFSIESNVKAKGEIVDLEDGDMNYDILSVNKLIDGNNQTGFIGIEKINTFDPNKTQTTVDNGNAYVIINLNANYSISGIKYQALTTNGELDSNTIKNYKIYVSKDKEHWDVAKTGTFNLTNDNNTEIVYFMKPGTVSQNQLYTFNDIAYVKIESVGKTTLSGSEFDIIAPPGDNIELDTIGVLEKDYTSGDETIKAGSVIIKGEYRGDPAFNIVTITDALDDTKVYNGYQLLFAEVEPDKHVYSVAKGTWMFIMTKEEYEAMRNGSTSIRANLSRANNMETDEDGSMVPTDERITSTSKSKSNLKSYSELEKITITDSNIKEN